MNTLKEDVSVFRSELRDLVSKRLREIQDRHQIGITSIGVELIDVGTMESLAKTGCDKTVLGQIKIDVEV